jgi:hypothetical protein
LKRTLQTFILVILLCIPLVILPGIPEVEVAEAVGENWLTGWTYRKSHVIQATSGAGTNYQIRITVHYGSGTDSGEHVYLNNNSRTDFGDIRFTDDDGSTLLDYWMESKTDSDNAIFWVEIADNLTASDVTIYIYYGKTDATTTSNGTATFIFFDDFDDGDASDWTYYESSGIFNGGLDTSRYHTTSYSYRMWENTGGYYDVYCEIYRSINFDGSTIKVDVQENHDSNGLTGYFFGKILIDSTEIASWDLGTSENQWIYRTSNTITPSSGSHTLRLRFYTDLSSDNLIQIWWDSVRIRKYVSPEPQHGSWGQEESEATITGFEAPSLVRAGEYFLLNMTILDLDGVNDFVNATITLEGSVTLKWDNATDSFSEISDPNNYVTLDASGSFKTQISSTSLKLSWKIKLSSSYPAGSTDVVDADVYDSEGFHGTSSDPGLFYFSGYSGWWNSSWLKRQPITVSENSGTNLTGYQIALNVTYDGDMRSDFGDLRFTWVNETADAEVLLDYWVESKTDGAWAYVWVEVAEIPASGISLVYMYYNNSAVTSLSNVTATLVLYDDFEDGTIDPMWSFQGLSSYSETGGALVLEANTDTWNNPDTGAHVSISPEISGYHIKVEAEWVERTSDLAQIYLAAKNSTGHIARVGMADGWSANSGQKSAWAEGGESYGSGAGTVPASGSATFEVFHFNNTYKMYWDSGLILTGSGSSSLSEVVLTNTRYGTNNGKTAEYHLIRVRKYVDLEPSASFLAEEQQSANNAPTVGSFEAPSTVYADRYFLLNVTVSDADGVADLDYATVQIGTVVLKWDGSTDSFSEESDPSGLCTLDASASIKTQLNSTSYKLSFRLKLSWSFTEGSVDVSATVYDVSAASGSGSQAGLFTFEDDVIVQSVWFSTGQQITVKGRIYYEGTSTPPTSGVTFKAEYGGSVKASTSSLTDDVFTLSWTESAAGLRTYTIYAVTDENSVQNQTVQAFTFTTDDGSFRWGFSNDTISSAVWDDAPDRLNVTFSSPANQTLYIHGRPTYILGLSFDLSTKYSGGWTRLDLNQTSTVTPAYPNWGDFYVHKLSVGEVTDAYWTEQVFTLVLNGTSGTSATLEIYTGSRGTPKSTSGFTGTPSYDSGTTILLGTITYESTVTVTLDYTMPVAGGGGDGTSGGTGLSILPAVSLSIAPVRFIQLRPGEAATGILSINFTGVNNIRVTALEFSGAAADWITLAEPLPKTIFKAIGELVGTGEVQIRIIAPEDAEPGEYTVPVTVRAEAVGSLIETNGYLTFSIIPKAPQISLVPEYMTWIFAALLSALVLYAYLKD